MTGDSGGGRGDYVPEGDRAAEYWLQRARQLRRRVEELKQQLEEAETDDDEN